MFAYNYSARLINKSLIHNIEVEGSCGGCSDTANSNYGFRKSRGGGSEKVEKIKTLIT